MHLPCLCLQVKTNMATVFEKQKGGMFTIFTLQSAFLGDLSHSNAYNSMVRVSFACVGAHALVREAAGAAEHS